MARMTRAKTTALRVGLVLVLASCAPLTPTVRSVPESERNDVVLQQVSSGHIGCPPGEITIADYRTVSVDPVDPRILSEAWTARCHAVDYYCSSSRQTLSCARDVRLTSGAYEGAPIE